MRRVAAVLGALFLSLITHGPTPSLASVPDEDPVVRAVLFYSPTCSHCHQVISEDLPNIFAKFGGRPLVRSLEGVGPDPLVRPAQPSAESPRTEPPRAEQPASSSAAEAEPEPAGADRSPTSQEAVEAADAYLNSLGSTALPGLAERLGRDPVGNGLGMAILLGMLVSLVGVAAMTRRRFDAAMPGVIIPTLLLVGMAVAAYMAYVEAEGATAVCGPVGDCNTVQQSRYATLFGVLPVGLLGLIAYGLMLGAWVVSKVAGRSPADIATAGFFLLAVAGTAFSAYLTFLEPFVIGAVCMWCLSSAVLITALMLLSTRAGVAAVRRIRRGSPA